MKVTLPRSIADFIELRHRLHAAPELSEQEAATSALVAELLTAWGYEVATGVGGHGVVATLRNGAGERSQRHQLELDILNAQSKAAQAMALLVSRDGGFSAEAAMVLRGGQGQ